MVSEITENRPKWSGARVSLALVMLLATFSQPSAAAPRYEYETTERGHYEAETAAKLGRGITNTMFGWMEIVHTPVAMAQPIDRGPISATLIGVPYGILRALGRTLVGVYEVTTAYAPQKPIFSEIPGDVR